MVERIVAVGLLTERDLQALGARFQKAYPVESLGGFVELLEAIDRADEQLRNERKTSH